MKDADIPEFAPLDQLKESVAQLPYCDRAAKVAVLARRVEHAIREDTAPLRAIAALVAACERALDDDPWMQLDRVARLLEQQIRAQVLRHPHSAREADQSV